MSTLLQIIQISLFVIAGICYIIASVRKYIKNKQKTAALEQEKAAAKSKLFEMYKKYFKENQNVEQSKTTMQEIQELEQTQGE